MRDAIVGTRTETVVHTYLVVRCARCRFEFEVETHETYTPRTTKCGRYGCGHVCRLDTADRIPDALPEGVTPIRRPA